MTWNRLASSNILRSRSTFRDYSPWDTRGLHDIADRLADLLASRPLTVQLERRLEDRARQYADRLNKRLAAGGDTDPYDVGRDEDLASMIMLLCETQLDEEDEAATRLASD